MSWRYKLASCDPAESRRLAAELDIHPVIAGILCGRGIKSPLEARSFLFPSLDELHDPFLLRGMHESVERIVRALGSRERVLIHGDFDTDGITSTALLVHALTFLGGDVCYFIPNRLEEGYGLRSEGIDAAHRRGASLLVTCDCGISSTTAVEYGNSLGIDTIITDHHQPEGNLPPAVAVVDPHRADCGYPFKDLAGVGVAAKLVLALHERIGVEANLPSLLRVCALGTVADVVPLVGENRIIAAKGLELLPGTPSVGIRALMEVSGLKQSEITATDISFRLAPRINAMGRFGRQDTAIELFFTKDKSRARKIASEMNELNAKRQRMVDRMVLQAVDKVSADPGMLDSKIVIVSDRRWHKGIVGIVASKLVDLYGLPALVIAEEEGVGFGSGRSIAGFDLLKALSQSCDVLGRFGGHAMAAGFELQMKDIGVLLERTGRFAKAAIPDEALERVFTVDAEISLDRLDARFDHDFRMLEPSGYGNTPPLFLARGVRLASEPRVLKDKHIKLQLKQGSREITALGWNQAEDLKDLAKGQMLEIIFAAGFNTWRGETELQLDLKALKRSK